jgi:hypothetical protein
VNARHDRVVGAGAAGGRPDEVHTEPRPNGELFARSIASSESLMRQIGSAGAKTSSWAIGESVGSSTTTVSWKNQALVSLRREAEARRCFESLHVLLNAAPSGQSGHRATHRGISPRPTHAAHRAR